MPHEPSPDEFWDVAARVCTDRQLEVLRLRAKGLGYVRIAVLLGVSRDTVRDHFQRASSAIIKAIAQTDERDAAGWRG